MATTDMSATAIQKSKAHPLFDPSMSFLGVYEQDFISCCRDTCTSLNSVVLFYSSKGGNQLNHPSPGGCKIGSIHMISLDSVIKKKEIIKSTG